MQKVWERTALQVRQSCVWTSLKLGVMGMSQTADVGTISLREEFWDCLVRGPQWVVALVSFSSVYCIQMSRIMVGLLFRLLKIENQVPLTDSNVLFGAVTYAPKTLYLAVALCCDRM